MPTPFPGMDPYLEMPGFWNQVHLQLIAMIQRFIAPRIRPKYTIDVDQTTYLTLTPPLGQEGDARIGRPDHLIYTHQSVSTLEAGYDDGGIAVAVAPPLMRQPVITDLPILEEETHRYLKIRTVSTGEVITVIEILSPANKQHDRDKYLSKRSKILTSMTHLVELDLLRKGKPMPMRLPYESDYRMLVSREARRPQAELYLFSVRDPIPDVPIPLLTGDEDIQVPLNQILHELYDVVGFDLKIDYQKPAVPPLSEEDAAWFQTLIV